MIKINQTGGVGALKIDFRCGGCIKYQQYGQKSKGRRGGGEASKRETVYQFQSYKDDLFDWMQCD